MILPILDYGDIIYDNCSAKDSKSLDVLHTRAARIVSGAAASTNTQRLLDEELGWELLKSRRQRHKLCLFYQIVNQLDVPPYLSALLPSFIGSSGGYHLRHNLNFKVFKTKSSMYQQSFFSSCVKLWNSLPDEQKCAPSIDILKRHLTSAHNVDYFGYGNRRHSVLLRLGHGLLQQQRFNVGSTNDPSCTCRCPKETEMHYILQCPLYSVARRKLLLKINNIVQEDFVLTSVLNQNSYQLLTLLLKGSDRLSLASNESIFAVMFEFIQTSGRFNDFQL